MEFIDRKSTYPNRYTMTDENGNVSLVTLERADEPVTEGTPLNAETFNALFLCSESVDYPGCYFHTVDGETEWLNPPMVENIVYRTTKRFNGYPVYTVAAVFPALAAEGSFVEKKFVNGTISKVLSMSTTYYPNLKEEGDDIIFHIQSEPLMDRDVMYAQAEMEVNSTLQCIRIYSRHAYADRYSAVCVVEFTKAEEAL